MPLVLSGCPATEFSVGPPAGFAGGTDLAAVFAEPGHAAHGHDPRKFGAEDRARRLYASITNLGAAEGIQFDFGAIRRTPNSVDAHRLVRYAARFGVADQLVHAIFRAHFVEGADIGNADTLSLIGAKHGLDLVACRNFLLTSEGSEHVHAENLHAHRLGINGVPCFLIDGEHAIAGAQEGEVLERLIELAASTPRVG